MPDASCDWMRWARERGEPRGVLLLQQGLVQCVAATAGLPIRTHTYQRYDLHTTQGMVPRHACLPARPAVPVCFAVSQLYFLRHPDSHCGHERVVPERYSMKAHRVVSLCGGRRCCRARAATWWCRCITASTSSAPEAVRRILPSGVSMPSEEMCWPTASACRASPSARRWSGSNAKGCAAPARARHLPGDAPGQGLKPDSHLMRNQISLAQKTRIEVLHYGLSRLPGR